MRFSDMAGDVCEALGEGVGSPVRRRRQGALGQVRRLPQRLGHAPNTRHTIPTQRLTSCPRARALAGHKRARKFHLSLVIHHL